MEPVAIVLTPSLNDMRRRFSLTQLLFITHMALVVWLVGSFSYTRYMSEWHNEIESEVRLAKTSLQVILKEVSFAAEGRNYNHVATSEALASYREIENLFYFEVDAQSRANKSYKIAWLKSADEVWNINASLENSSSLEEQIRALKEKAATAPETEHFKINYALDRLIDKQEQLINHVRLENLFGNLYFLPEFPENDYVLDGQACLLYVKIPLLGNTEGYVWAVFDADALSTFKVDTLQLIVREAIVAILFSIALIFWATKRIIQPIHRLAQTMEGDIDSIDVDSIPERDRTDELGQLAQRYASLIKRIQSQMMGLRRQSLFDVLTGVYSRFAYETQANVALENARSNKRWFGLIVIDIDNFKAYNDEFGHAVGDEALQIVAKALRASINPHSDKVYRFGGEEFVVVCEKSSSTSITMLAELLRKNVWLKKVAHPNNADLGYVTCSVGVSMAEYTETELSLKALFKKADFALYQAKDSGRNRVVTAPATMCNIIKSCSSEEVE